MMLNLFKSVNENLRIKIFVTFVLLIFSISCSFTFFFLHRQSKSLTDALIKNGNLLAGVLAYNSRIGVFSESGDLLDAAADGILRQEGILRVLIFNVEGKLLKSKERPEIGTLGESVGGDEASRRKMMGTVKETVSPSSRSGDNAAEFWSPVISASDSYGESSLFFKDDSLRRKTQVIGFAAITVDKRPLNKALNGLLFKTIFMGIAFLMIGSVIAYFVVRGITKPLNRLIEGVKTFGVVGTTEDFAVETKDEIGNLARAFNNMAESLRNRENALRDSEAKYKELSDSIADVFFAVDNNLKCTYWNKTSEALTGIAAKDAVGKAIGTIFPAMIENRLIEGIYHQVFRDKRSQTFIYEYQNGDKRYIFEVDIYSAKTGLSVYAKDVTERRLMEEALKKSELDYRRLFENSLMGISEVLSDGRLIRANMAYANMYGYASPEEMMMEVTDIGQQLYVNPENRKEVLRILGEKGYMEPKECLVRRRDGSLFHVVVTAQGIRDISGKLISYHATHMDITERRKADDELKRSYNQLRALAERLQQIREESQIAIAQEIHDELGGGLTGVKINLSWLLQKIEEEKTDKDHAPLMKRIHAAIQLIDELILNVRRIGIRLRPPILDDLGLIATLEWECEEFSSRTGIQCEFVSAFEYVELEETAAMAVFRIFQEALTNVARHSGADKVTVLFREDGGHLYLEVIDSGKGITDKNILSMKSLGLLGMRERALVFGGELSISGKSGTGTTVVLKIPQGRGKSA